MSDSESEIDISKAIGLDTGFSSSSDDSSSEDSDFYQDEIIDSSSDEEENEQEDNDDDNTKTEKKDSNNEILNINKDRLEKIRQFENSAKSESTEEPVDLGKFPKLEMSDDDSDSDSDNNNSYNDNKTGKKRSRKDDDDDDDAFFNKLGVQAQGTKKKSIYSFRGLGLSKLLCANVARRGFKMATPIQRKTIPYILEGRDVVGMARTGSGKTAAFVLPLLDRLKSHSATVGIRAIILSPSRELAEQTMRVVKEFSRGTDLRCALIVGGTSLDDQFKTMTNNPDIVIATPGRFLHLKIEMKLDLRSVQHIIFDEADRLFELGFAEQLNEVLAALSRSRQTLLFSATLPKSLVEFAKAGLQDPVLLRLDAETKISEDLEMSYFAIKDGEREAALAYILGSVIKMPIEKNLENRDKFKDDDYNSDDDEDDDDDDDDDENEDNENDKGKKKNKSKKGKKFEKRKKLPHRNELPSPYSTIVFTPTKYHVEYIAQLLKALGYAVSYIYGALDQTARKDQLYKFRSGRTTVLVVTDVAARGIDIPVLANVINYSLPSSPKVFVHRVGRTARAGNRGWAYSLIREMDIPYLLDLELFLGRKLLIPPKVIPNQRINYTERLVLGSFPREDLEQNMEEVDAIMKKDYDLSSLRDVAKRGERQYLKSRESASQESSKRSKEILNTPGWDGRHPLFGTEDLEKERESFLEKLANRSNKDTVFEYKKTQFADVAELMQRRRQQIAPIRAKAEERKALQKKEAALGLVHTLDAEMFSDDEDDDQKKDLATEQELEKAFPEKNLNKGSSGSKKKKKDYKDSNFYMSHYAAGSSAAEDRAYSINGGKTEFFGDAARNATFDLNEEGKEFVQKQGMKWDKKRGKYINAGSTGDKKSQQPIKYIRGENGTKIPASYRSGRYDAWREAHKAAPLRVGTAENPDGSNKVNFNAGVNQMPIGSGSGGGHPKHKKVVAPKRADKARDDYHKQRKKVSSALERGIKIKGKQPLYNGESEIHSVDEVRKARELLQKRREKNARPSKKKKTTR